MALIADRLAAVRGRIEAACERAGREPSEVTLVAVSKRHPASAVREAWEAGQRVFGENYAQELVDKAEVLEGLEGLEWHFIGHLQRNKAKPVARVGAVVQTVDSARLARALAHRAEAEGRTLDVFLQVDVAGEAQKAGCTPEALPSLAAEVRALAGLRCRGLMTIPPFEATPEANRPRFAHLARLARELGVEGLSMGMSADLDVAVEEGATLVRVGTAIFGPRPA